MIIKQFHDGYVINGDSTSVETIEHVKRLVGDDVKLIVSDPPYGNVVNESWDRTEMSDDQFAEWMNDWTHKWADVLCDGGAFYVWGGIGTPGFRPFLKYVPIVESNGVLKMSTLITWSKKRGYGLSYNYLFTREELAYFVKGNPKKPCVFNVPYLDKIRGYSGFNAKYPAKDARYRRTNVWTDVTELLRGKTHPTQKPTKTSEILIETHTHTGDYVIDPFAGSGVTAKAARNLNRRFVVIESKKEYFDELVESLT